MIRAEALVSQLVRRGFRIFSGVPCSYLTPAINRVIGAPDLRYIGAANEGDAVAVAAGAELGGTPAVALFQNSGLGNAVSPLTSLTPIFRIPVLLVVTWRGAPGRPPDEPQHQRMGPLTTTILDVMGIPWEVVPETEEEFATTVDRAVQTMADTSGPFALVLHGGTVLPYPLADAGRPRWIATEAEPLTTGDQEVHDQDDVLRVVLAQERPSDVVVATTGFTGRALWALDDRPNHFYMVGSMGCASSFALGLAASQPDRRVIVLDGDGAALMRMGALATIGHERPPNLVHVLLDNGVHDSTGSQATVSPTADLAAIAAACGYPRAKRVSTLDDLRRALGCPADALSFLHVRTEPRSDRRLPRPTVSPDAVAARLRKWMEANPCQSLDACVCSTPAPSR
jgi:phosphonopyruvate decarboxylase